LCWTLRTPILLNMKRRELFAAGVGLVAFSGRAMAQQGPIRTHALSLLGTPALPPDFPHWPWVNPNAPQGGEVTLSGLGSFDSLNPFIMRGTSALGLVNIYDQLLASSSNEASTEYAHLAEVVEIPADRMGVSFELRESARWHDGRSVTAEDVVWTFNTLIRDGRPFYRAYWGDVAEAVAESPRRVTFRFRSNENRELALILGQIFVLPRHFWEGRDFARPLQDIPLGSGSYRVESFESGRSITYRHVPDHWSRRQNTNIGRQNFEVLRYEYFRDATVAFEAFKAGQVDFRTENIARNWNSGYDFPAHRRGLVKRDEIRHEIPTGMQAFVMNLRRPLFQDARVREALMHVFDYEWLNANIFGGMYARTTSFFSNSELASSGLPQGRELEILERYRGRVPESVFTTEFRLPVTDGSGNNREGARRGLALLREAGWEVRNRRLVNAQGQPFSFEILLNGATFERVALPYVQWLQRLGVEARVRTVDPAQYQVRTDAFDYDMTVDVIGQGLSPGNEQRDYWTCQKARENGSNNIAGICDPVIDELVEMLISAPDRDELIHRTRALDRVLLHNHFVIPQWHSREFRVAFWDRFGRPERNPRYALGFETWWIDPARDAALTAARRG
jgi:microcin C transport system substrate-binding protein